MKRDSIIEGTRLNEVLREEVRLALCEREVATTEMAEFYLVNLLGAIHSMKARAEGGGGIFERPLAVLLMEAMSGDLKTRICRLRQIGDNAMVIVGLFADRIKRSLMDVPYFVAMGGGAYGSLADILGAEQTFAELYSELSLKFNDFAGALSLVAPWNRAASDADLLRIYERWLSTGDRKLQEVLEESGIATVGAAPPKIQ